ncbi:hypothetical protein KP509_18G043500 [Ceratopteris richardii]|uniref:Uncharacterized protein n=1 Tax=Ceratopteris richardii TaxID=49495 RepID=A0A8T2SP70_CERRI|nr:hypothetical protein KP509_18G043500 [Ceratopteris richardii]
MVLEVPLYREDVVCTHSLERGGFFLLAVLGSWEGIVLVSSGCFGKQPKRGEKESIRGGLFCSIYVGTKEKRGRLLSNFEMRRPSTCSSPRGVSPFLFVQYRHTRGFRAHLGSYRWLKGDTAVGVGRRMSTPFFRTPQQWKRESLVFLCSYRRSENKGVDSSSLGGATRSCNQSDPNL